MTHASTKTRSQKCEKEWSGSGQTGMNAAPEVSISERNHKHCGIVVVKQFPAPFFLFARSTWELDQLLRRGDLDLHRSTQLHHDQRAAQESTAGTLNVHLAPGEFWMFTPKSFLLNTFLTAIQFIHNPPIRGTRDLDAFGLVMGRRRWNIMVLQRARDNGRNINNKLSTKNHHNLPLSHILGGCGMPIRVKALI